MTQLSNPVGLMARLAEMARRMMGGAPEPKIPDPPDGTPLTSYTRDAETASEELADRFTRAYPSRDQAMVGSGFDRNRDYDGERDDAADLLKEALSEDEWRRSTTYEAWVARAARTLRI